MICNDEGTMDYRLIIIEALDIMRKKSIAEKEPFKARAYQNVIAQLTIMKSFGKDDIPLLRGAGDKITKKIEEIIETGGLAAAEKAKQQYNLGALEAFQKIYGVGPVKARQLISKGITSIAHLRSEVENDDSLLNEKQMIGLKYYEPLLERIPYEEMQDHERILCNALYDVDPMLEGDIVGSYRRCASSSGDIDLLVKGNVDIKKIVEALGETGYLLEILALGKNKCMAICSIGTPRRLDILVTPEKEYAYALLYFTGSQDFNVTFRSHALSCGYTLNEHEMKPIGAGKPVPYMKTEKDIFLFLNLSYVEPRHRSTAKNLVLLE